MKKPTLRSSSPSFNTSSTTSRSISSVIPATSLSNSAPLQRKTGSGKPAIGSTKVKANISSNPTSYLPSTSNSLPETKVSAAPKGSSSPLIHFFSSSTNNNTSNNNSNTTKRNSPSLDVLRSSSNFINNNNHNSNNNPKSVAIPSRKKLSVMGERDDRIFIGVQGSMSKYSSHKTTNPFHYGSEDEEDVDPLSPASSPENPFIMNESPLLRSSNNQFKNVNNGNIVNSKIPLLTPPPVPKNKLNLQYRIKKARPTSPQDKKGEKALKVSIYSKSKPLCDETTHPTGEDAYFCCYSNKYELYSFGIADGVGGWMAFDIDPSLCSRQLMWNCKMLLCNDQLPQIISEQNYNIPKELEQTVMKAIELPQVIHPKILLERSFSLLSELNQVQAGGTTSCIVFLKPLPQNLYQLSYANLGDSGFVVINKSKSKIIYRSKEQQHYFNAPYQLSVIPAELDSDELIRDDPNSADLHINCCTLREGDYIVLATDGLFDNMFDHDILKVAKSCNSCHSIAKKLVQEAVRRYSAVALSSHTPFSLGLSKITGDYRRHGKADDVTVCCVCVC
ncbi:hypothetical protein ABK040_008440 [Willaertia magna]